MTDYYLDASVGIDGAGTEVSPFRVLNGKTFANYDRVWIRRTGPSVSIVNAAYTVPNVIGLELIGWPMPDEYGYNQRGTLLPSWDADVETHWHAFITTAGTTFVMGSTTDYLLVRRGVIRRTTVAGAAITAQMQRTVTWDRCEFRSILASNTILSQVSDSVFPRTFLDCSVLSQGNGGGDSLLPDGTGSRAVNIINMAVTFDRTTATGTWAPRLLEGTSLHALRLSTIIFTVSRTPTCTLPSNVEMVSGGTNGGSIGTLKISSSDQDATYSVMQSATSTYVPHNDTIIKIPNIVLDRDTTNRGITQIKQFNNLNITCDTLSGLRLRASYVKIYPRQTTVNMQGNSYGNTYENTVFIKNAVILPEIVTSFQTALMSGQWVTETNASIGTLCNVRRTGSTTSPVYIQQRSFVIPSTIGGLPDPIFVGSFKNPFNSLFTETLAAGTHTITLYMADYTLEPNRHLYQYRMFTVEYCISGVSYYQTTSIVKPDNSVWVNDTNLEAYKMEVTVTLPSSAIVTGTVIVNDVGIPDAYTYVDTTPVIT